MSATRARVNRSLRRLLALPALSGFLALAVVAVAVDGRAAEQPIEGPWQGTLKTGAIDLRIVFHFARDKQGNLSATMDSPDQGAKGIAINSAARNGDKIVLEARGIGGRYEGKLSDDGRTIQGKWKQSGRTFTLDLARLDKEPDFRRPQDPKKPYPYGEEQVSFENRAAGVKLAGTLTLPKSQPRVPAVILLTGSGAQDRDESIVGHKPFLVLADYLTRRGIAVLRCDDRGVGGSTGSTNDSNTAQLADDALAGVAFLKRRKEIDPRRIGLVGHSEGGLIAPLAASRSADVAFIVMLAGTGVTGERIVLHQGELIARAEKADEKKIAESQDLQREIFAIIRQEPDNDKATQRILAAVAASESFTSAPTPEAKAAIQAQVSQQTKVILAPWFRYFLSYDPAVALREVRCGVLALCGEKDLQVDPKQNLPPIATALREAGNRDVTILELPGLNHLFQHCKTGSPTEYSKIDETFSPEALGLIADWILERAK